MTFCYLPVLGCAAINAVHRMDACSSLVYLQVFDPEFRKGFPNVQRWYLTLLHFPHFDAVFQVKDLAKERIKGMLLLLLSALQRYTHALPSLQHEHDHKGQQDL